MQDNVFIVVKNLDYKQFDTVLNDKIRYYSLFEREDTICVGWGRIQLTYNSQSNTLIIFGSESRLQKILSEQLNSLFIGIKEAIAEFIEVVLSDVDFHSLNFNL